MSKPRIELIPVKKQVSFSASEWLVIVMYVRYQNLDKLREKLRLDANSLNSILKNLEKKNVLRITREQADSGSAIPAVFWTQLEKELSRHIGPIASAVIDDELASLNNSRESISKDKLYSLVEKIASEIDSQSGKVQFQNTMLDMIKSI
ncbi:MAG: hypothetical protein ACQES5_04780 [Thermodesulfobacteriota bacterium]